MRTKKQDSLVFLTPSAGIDINKCSFFPKTIRGSLISASDCAEDSVTNFTSVVRLESQVLVNDCRWT